MGKKLCNGEVVRQGSLRLFAGFSVYSRILKKEVFKMSMRIFKYGVCVAIAGFIFAGTSQLSATIDATVVVAASATVTGATGLSVQAKNRSNDANADGNLVNWGTVSGETLYGAAAQYLVLSATSNVLNTQEKAWWVDIYTDNTKTGATPQISANASAKVYDVDGLISTDTTNGTTTFFRVPILWIITSSKTLTAVNLGGPTTTNTINGSTTTASVGWTYLKDKADLNNPDTIAVDESWNGVKVDGYPVCLWGGGGGERYLTYSILTTKPSSNIYLEGDFSAACGGKGYATKIWFDLYH